MSVTASPSIFDVFNARQLTPEQVAKTFVAPPHFENLAKPTHTLIVGPRGSGKTTLLKMLHPAALAIWKGMAAAKFRDQIDFTGVFIATDINWNEQVRSLGDGRLDDSSHRQFAKAAFTTQILQSLLESMSFRTQSGRNKGSVEKRRVILSTTAETDICRQLINSWQLTDTIPSLEGIRLALAERLSLIHVLASQEGNRPLDGRGVRVADIPFIHLDFLSAAGVAVEAFNSKVGEQGGRWALLFDELELAPAWIRTMLIRYLRSVDQRFLFKISLSPYSVDLKRELNDINSAGAHQDFEPIRLWYVNKEQSYPFCKELLQNMLVARGYGVTDPEQLFGTSAFASKDSEWRGKGSAYHPKSRIGRAFMNLASRDRTFAAYLKRRNISLESMNEVSGVKRAADLRKARSIVALRAYFKGEGRDLFQEHAQGRRSRKVPKIYAGATSLFAMVEGNPRWFIGIVSQLLQKTPTGQRVAEALQVRAVRDAADVFRAMLATIPCGETGGLLKILDPVGEYFSRAAIDGDFDPDPPCSFQIDSAIDDDALRALGMALNAGAIVYAPEEGDVGILESLREKRFRLSYILAPHYFIPLVLGRVMPLSRILRRNKTETRSITPEATLFSLD